MAGKVLRLGKVANELNVGHATIVEFLASKGVEINPNPNTKIEKNAYELLLDQFSADQSVKEKSKHITQPKEKRETVSLSPVEEEEEDVTPQEEESIAPQKEKEENNSGPKVIGKIDLSAINSRTRPEKKSKKKEDPKPEKTTQKDESSTKKAEEKLPEPEQKPSKPVKEEIETIRTKVEKLPGLTVIKKIDLPVEKSKSDTHKNNNDNKPKRKRIKKANETVVSPNVSKNRGSRNTKKGKEATPQATEQEIQKEIKETLARLSGGGKSKGSKNRRAKREDRASKREMEAMEAELNQGVLKLSEFVSVSELASMMNIQSTEVISTCMTLGIFVSINQRLDAETIQIVADEFGFETEFVSAEVQEAIPIVEDKAEDLLPRSPIVTVMGHVDHGKTSLLDNIRKADVTAGEAGGITQHIGAYSVKIDEGKQITFLDTPGHEAFTAMRARGAQVTDIAIIIIAADDDVMPQTKEAISHAQAANVPMIFAINKIDKDGANPDRIREQLSAMNILVEEWGGKYQSQEISAKKGLNIDKLLDKILLEAELLDLKANPNKDATGTVLESSLDKGKGYITNILVEEGTLKVGNVILAGRHTGRVRAMHNERGEKLEDAGPAIPVSILGLTGAPSAGDKFYVFEDEREARSIATKREQLYREQGMRTQKHVTLDEIGRRLAIGDFKELNLIVKGDVDGSIEALSDSLLKLSTEEIQVNIIYKGVGQITETDVNLASASDAIIIAFQVRPSVAARKLAEAEQIDIRMYSVIYKAIDEIKSAMEGMLSPDIEEKILGTAEIRETFNISKVGTIAGCYVTSGVIKRTSKVRVIRDGIVTHAGELGSLKRFKDDVKEVKNNFECGLNIEKYNDIKEGDIIEAYEEVEVARKL